MNKKFDPEESYRRMLDDLENERKDYDCKDPKETTEHQ
jgi:hypothetical protein